MPKLYHVTPYKNWRKIKTAGLLPKRGKRGMYVDDPNEPRIYLFESPETADDAMTNWLVDWYPEDRYFAIIEVTLPLVAQVYEDPELAGSYYVTKMILPKQMKLFKKQDAGEPEEFVD